MLNGQSQFECSYELVVSLRQFNDGASDEQSFHGVKHFRD